jgi:hypothetical protein
MTLPLAIAIQRAGGPLSDDAAGGDQMLASLTLPNVSAPQIPALGLIAISVAILIIGLFALIAAAGATLGPVVPIDGAGAPDLWRSLA